MPAADLGRLAACVTEEVLVSGVRGGLGPLLGSLRCRLIVIKNVSLTPAETRSLVTAMTTCLKTVFLGRYDRIELFDFDINAFGNKLPPPDIGILVHMSTGWVSAPAAFCSWISYKYLQFQSHRSAFLY